MQGGLDVSGHRKVARSVSLKEAYLPGGCVIRGRVEGGGSQSMAGIEGGGLWGNGLAQAGRKRLAGLRLRRADHSDGYQERGDEPRKGKQAKAEFSHDVLV